MQFQKKSEDREILAKMLSDLKAGDTVGVYGRHSGNHVWQTAKIERLTEKFFVIGGKKFYRDDGRQYGGDKWSHYSMRPMQSKFHGKTVAEWIKEDARNIKRDRLAGAVNGVKWQNLSLEALEAIHALILQDAAPKDAAPK